MENFWEKMDIGIFPSLYGEGIPKSMLEAVSFRCPVITSDVRGFVDFSENQKNSILFETGNINSLASAIIFLATDYERRIKISKSALDLLNKYYSSSIIQKEYSKLYRIVVN